MRFLFVNHHASAPAYGNPYRTYHLARELVEAGHQVTIVAAAWSHTRQTQPEISNRALWTEFDGITFCFLPAPKYGVGFISRVWNILGFLRSYRSHWKEIARRVAPNVVVEATTHVLPIYTSAKIAHSSGATLIFESRDLWPQTLIDLGVSRYQPFVQLVKHAQKTALNRADGVVSTLIGADKYYGEQGLQSKAFFHIQNGFFPADFDRHREDDIDAVRKLRELHARYAVIIGYAGAIGRVNSIDLLINTAPQLSKMNVAVVFFGEGERKRTHQERARNEGLENVFFFDAVPKAHVMSVLRYFDLGFVGGKARPIHRYGVSPNKLFDYMAASVPVLFCIDSPDNIVQSVKCGYEISDPSPTRLIAAVRQFMELPTEERTLMGARGHRYAMANFTYSALAQRYIEAVAAISARR